MFVRILIHLRHGMLSKYLKQSNQTCLLSALIQKASPVLNGPVDFYISGVLRQVFPPWWRKIWSEYFFIPRSDKDYLSLEVSPTSPAHKNFSLPKADLESLRWELIMTQQKSARPIISFGLLQRKIILRLQLNSPTINPSHFAVNKLNSTVLRLPVWLRRRDSSVHHCINDFIGRTQHSGSRPTSRQRRWSDFQLGCLRIHF